MLSVRQVWPRDKWVPPATGQAGILQNCAPRVSSRPHAPVAQLDRVPDYESGGRTFESCQARHTDKKASQQRGLFVCSVCFGREDVSVRQTLLHAVFGRQSAAAAPRRGLNAGGNRVEIYRARRAAQKRASQQWAFIVCPACSGREGVFGRQALYSRSSGHGNSDRLFLYDMRSQNRARSV